MIYKLDKNTHWSSLPWENIYNKIFFIQRQIYKSSQSCKLNTMNKYQKYLLNCNETKILAIDHIINYIKNYYKYSSTEIYKMNDEDKFIVFQHLFTKYNNNDIVTFILEYVKQYIIYLCIEPEWKSKIILSNLCINNLKIFFITKKYELKLLKNNIINIFKYNYIDDKINSHYLNVIKYTKHVQKYLKFKMYINYWINNNIFQKNTFNNIKIYDTDEFFYLIYWMNNSILDWNKVILQKIKKYKLKLTIDEYFNKTIKNSVYYNCIRNIKLIISTKNIKLNLYYIIYQLLYYLEITYQNNIFISEDIIKNLYMIINNIIYYWCKKKYKQNIFNKYTYIHNKFLNQFFYCSKFNAFYHKNMNF